MREHWFDRAVEDRLGEIIDKYRSQGKDVHNVGALRNKVANDLDALRGTSQWVALTQRYDPKPTNKVAWCCVCDKPVARHSVSAWLEDKTGNVFCSKECQADTRNHPISYVEYRRRMREAGSMTTRRREIVGGEVVLGEEFTLTWDDIKDQRLPAGVTDISGDDDVVEDDEIIW
jgi:hypothetical protein